MASLLGFSQSTKNRHRPPTMPKMFTVCNIMRTRGRAWERG